MIQKVTVTERKPIRLPFYSYRDVLEEVYKDYQYHNLSPSEQDIYHPEMTPNATIRIKYLHYLKVGQVGIINKGNSGGQYNLKLTPTHKSKLMNEIDRLK